MDIKVKNSNWFRSKHSNSIYFKISNNEGIGLKRRESINDAWFLSSHITFRSVPKNWEKVESVKEILNIINIGMKSKLFNSDTLVNPFGLNRFVKLSDYHFDLKNKYYIDLLMVRGNLNLVNKKGDNILILSGGNFCEHLLSYN